ncbi:MAG: helix-turn-helix transcriptional regulator [Clostridia bacterium]|nr:helix-turn-helix transcriptional regulator [Clostridia bacterium]
MRTKPIVTHCQTSDVTFYVERRESFAFYRAEYWEVILPVEGDIELSYEGKRSILKVGRLAALSPKITRRLTLKTDSAENPYYLSVRISEACLKSVFDLVDPDSFEVFASQEVFRTDIDDLHRSDILSALEYVHIADDENREILLKKLVYSIFFRILPFKKYMAYQDVTHRAITVMNDPACISYRLPDVAEKVGCSEEYLVRCFKKSGMDTPNNIYKRIKLRYAKSVLTSSKISVTEVSNMIGFKSVGHFNKLYLSEYGVCPGADKIR